MKFNEKYPQLKEKQFLFEILSSTVYSTMALENQVVSMPKIQEIVNLLLNDHELKRGKFGFDQSR